MWPHCCPCSRPSVQATRPRIAESVTVFCTHCPHMRAHPGRLPAHVYTLWRLRVTLFCMLTGVASGPQVHQEPCRQDVHALNLQTPLQKCVASVRHGHSLGGQLCVLYVGVESACCIDEGSLWHTSTPMRISLLRWQSVHAYADCIGSTTGSTQPRARKRADSLRMRPL